ncbi:TM2 domain-containing protein [Exiguobacterium sp. s63]|uniref:TM2 domain-containing protein n=1 Tax=Exiguobacterium sp. s63 TaxID=2751274 RepID=UPI001BEC8E82|nr:TM2 domain-containing protein [Exiguobacterium sp. s63]
MNVSRMDLTTEEMQLVNSEVEKRKRSLLVAYLLWFFLGALGAHRFYFKKIGSGIAMVLLVVLTLGFGAIITGIWALVDAFLMPSWQQREVEQIERETIELLQTRSDRYTGF